jgi:hypothetical protein
MLHTDHQNRLMKVKHHEQADYPRRSGFAVSPHAGRTDDPLS